MNSTFDTIQKRVEAVCASRDDIISAGVFGSRARKVRPADRWSDLDLLLFVTEPELFLRESEWLHSVGRPLIDFHETGLFGSGVERRVLFEGYLDVDFVFFPADAFEQVMTNKGASSWVRSGFSLIVDKDGRLSEMLARRAARLPESEQSGPIDFQNLVADYFFHVVWAAKKLMRGEILVAKNCCDTYMKKLLLRLLSANVAAKGGTPHIPGDEARFFEQWAGDAITAKFSSIYATYDRENILGAIQATTEVFSDLAKETAALLGQEYPAGYEVAAMAFLKSF